MENSTKIGGNLRIQIQNNLSTDAMDIDEDLVPTKTTINEAEDEEEEGELIEEDDEASTGNHWRNRYAPPSNEKLRQRAERFQLKTDEMPNFTEDHLQMLRHSLGINKRNMDVVRYDALHMRGIRKMMPEDVLDYFIKYAPHSVEWLDEDSCNVVWLDEYSAQCALHSISEPIRGLPVRPLNTFSDEDEQLDSSPPHNLFDDCIDVADINTIEIPPGYWRLGKKHPKATYVLLRFALRTDKQPFKKEQFSRYYSNTNNNGISKKRTQIRYRNQSPDELRNPWEVLAKNWDEDRDFREREPPSSTGPNIRKNSALQHRLGTKRTHYEDYSSASSTEDTSIPATESKSKVPRMRMYADDEEEKIIRKRILTTIQKQMDKIENSSTDLRSKLKSRNPIASSSPKESSAPVANTDLALTLKNRNRKMQFAIKRDDAREKLHLRLKKRDEHDVDDFEDEDFNNYRNGSNKPRSKVAVVIKTHKKPSLASAISSTSRLLTKLENDQSDDSSSSDEPPERLNRMRSTITYKR